MKNTNKISVYENNTCYSKIEMKAKTLPKFFELQNVISDLYFVLIHSWRYTVNSLSRKLIVTK